LNAAQAKKYRKKVKIETKKEMKENERTKQERRKMTE
jgi:hypothetical protein